MTNMQRRTFLPLQESRCSPPGTGFALVWATARSFTWKISRRYSGSHLNRKISMLSARIAARNRNRALIAYSLRWQKPIE